MRKNTDPESGQGSEQKEDFISVGERKDAAAPSKA